MTGYEDREALRRAKEACSKVTHREGWCRISVADLARLISIADEADRGDAA